MKSLFIIAAYTPTIDKQKLLAECVQAIREAGTNFDIMITAHSPISSDIIDMVDYYVYDKDNRFSRGNSMILWKQAHGVTVNRYVKKSHEYPIIRLVRNAFHLAKVNEYEFFFGTDFDNIFSKEDIKKLLVLKSRMIEENKSLIFFYPSNAVWTVDDVPLYGIYYDMGIHGGLVSEFLDGVESYFPKTLEEYNEKLGYVIPGRPQALEHYFYDAFKEKQHNVLTIEGTVKQYVTGSQMNKSGFMSTIVMILPGDNGKHYLYVTNDNIEAYEFVIFFNGIHRDTYELQSKTNIADSFRVIELTENCFIRAVVYKDKQYVTEYTLQFNIDDTTKYDGTGLIHVH
jgi:hypothetical protein